MVRVVAYADYLCPWCYIGTVRLLRIQEEYREGVDLQFRSYPLLREDTPGRRFGPKQADAWGRAATEEPSLKFNPWPVDQDLPRSSLPAQEAAKCAALQGQQPFLRLHVRLLEAYFAEGRDISQGEALLTLAEGAGLDMQRFARDFDGGSQRESVLADYRQAIATPRFTGVPTAIFDDQAVLEGAVPLDVYRRAVEVMLRERSDASPGN